MNVRQFLAGLAVLLLPIACAVLAYAVLWR